MNKLGIFETLPKGLRRIVTNSDYELAWNTVTRAFADVYYPIPTVPMSYEEYIELYGELTHRWLEHSLEYGEVISNEDISAVVILSPADNCCDLCLDEVRNKLTGYETSGGLQNAIAIMKGAAEDEKNLKLSGDGIYLEVFAVHPDRQGQGCGAGLLRKLMKECEQAERELSLLTNAPKNVPMYEHFGFEMLLKREDKKLNTVYNYLIRRPVK